MLAREPESAAPENPFSQLVEEVRIRCLHMLSQIPGYLQSEKNHEAPISDTTISERIDSVAQEIKNILDAGIGQGRNNVDEVTQHILARLYLAVIYGNAVRPVGVNPILKHFKQDQDNPSCGRVKLNRTRAIFHRSPHLNLQLLLEGKKGSSFYYPDLKPPKEHAIEVTEMAYSLVDFTPDATFLSQNPETAAQLEKFLGQMRAYKGRDFVFRGLLEACQHSKPVKFSPWDRRMIDRVKRAEAQMAQADIPIKIAYSENGICWPFVDRDNIAENCRQMVNIANTAINPTASPSDPNDPDDPDDPDNQADEVIEKLTPNPELQRRIRDGVRHLSNSAERTAQVTQILTGFYSSTIRNRPITISELAKAIGVQPKTIGDLIRRIRKCNEHFPTILGFNLEEQATGGYLLVLTPRYQRCELNYNCQSAPVPVEIKGTIEFDRTYFKELIEGNNFFPPHARALEVLAERTLQHQAISQPVFEQISGSPVKLRHLREILREMDLGIHLEPYQFNTYYLTVKRPKKPKYDEPEQLKIAEAKTLCTRIIEEAGIPIPTFFSFIKGSARTLVDEQKPQLAEGLQEILQADFDLNPRRKLFAALLGLATLSGHTMKEDDCAALFTGTHAHYVGVAASSFEKRMDIPMVVDRQYLSGDSDHRELCYFLRPVDKETYHNKEPKLLPSPAEKLEGSKHQGLVDNLADVKAELGVLRENYDLIIECFLDAARNNAAINIQYIWTKARKLGKDIAFSSIIAAFYELRTMIQSGEKYFGCTIEMSEDCPVRYFPTLTQKDKVFPYEIAETKRRIDRFARTVTVADRRAAELVCTLLFERTVRQKGRVPVREIRAHLASNGLSRNPSYAHELLGKINEAPETFGIHVDSVSGCYKIELLLDINIVENLTIGLDIPYSSSEYAEALHPSYPAKLSSEVEQWVSGHFSAEKSHNFFVPAVNFILANSLNRKMTSVEDIVAHAKAADITLSRSTVVHWIGRLRERTIKGKAEIRNFDDKYFFVTDGYDHFITETHQQRTQLEAQAKRQYDADRERFFAGTSDDTPKVSQQQTEKERFESILGELPTSANLNTHVCGVLTAHARSTRGQGKGISFPYVKIFEDEITKALARHFVRPIKKDHFQHLQGFLRLFISGIGEEIIRNNPQLTNDVLAENLLSYLYWQIRTNEQLRDSLRFILQNIEQYSKAVFTIIRRAFAQIRRDML